MPQKNDKKISQDEDKITSTFEDTLLEKSNIILLGPTGCGTKFF
jgi:ATP-dependent protease Clp ATPase subunit